jgi:MFS family permease
VSQIQGEELAKIQARTVRTLAIGQALGGFGFGSTLSVGAIMATELSGSAAWSGAAATLSTLGSAFVAIPLAHIAARRASCTGGRSRPSNHWGVWNDSGGNAKVISN